jgi:hypothetical protein
MLLKVSTPFTHSTLNRIEDNVVSGKEDVVKAKQEM